MNNVENIIEHAEKRCKVSGSRLTDKRKRVLFGLLQSQKALSAYELSEFCSTEFGEKIPAMSVYRILDFLEQEHLVHKLHLANKYIACAHITCQHSHEVQQFLICGQCQTVKEISVSKVIIDALQDNIEKAGFHLSSSQLEMNCICKNCLSTAA